MKIKVQIVYKLYITVIQIACRMHKGEYVKLKRPESKRYKITLYKCSIKVLKTIPFINTSRKDLYR